VSVIWQLFFARKKNFDSCHKEGNNNDNYNNIKNGLWLWSITSATTIELFCICCLRFSFANGGHFARETFHQANIYSNLWHEWVNFGFFFTFFLLFWQLLWLVGN